MNVCGGVWHLKLRSQLLFCLLLRQCYPKYMKLSTTLPLFPYSYKISDVTPLSSYSTPSKKHGTAHTGLVSQGESNQQSAGYVSLVEVGLEEGNWMGAWTTRVVGRNMGAFNFYTCSFYTVQKIFPVFSYLQCGSRKTMLVFLLKICFSSHQC